MDYPFLFSPITINGMELKNRIVMTAMHLGYTPDGEVTDRLVDFYSLRASGGAGLIIAGGCRIDDFGAMPSMIGLHDDIYINGLKRLTAGVKNNGSKIAAQLYHAGRYTHSSTIGGKKPISSSAIRSKLTGETPRALEQDEIVIVQNKFAEAALRAKTAGFDAVEILGSAGYLISQFLSPITNVRDDQYGGSFENRMRFGLEVTEKVRMAVGPDFPVIIRLAGNEFMDNGNGLAEAIAFAVELEKRSIDLFNITGGWHETRIPQLTMNVPRMGYIYLAQAVKHSVNVPVLASNRINDPSLGDEIIRNGQADLVTTARAFIADPDFARKAMTGKSHLIYHCVACNQGCFDNIFKSAPATCLVNPRAGREQELRSVMAAHPRKVLVIGGGVAGLKAACTAAERGHNVILVEKTKKIGGQLLLNKNIPGREELTTVVKDLIENLRDLDLQIIFEKEADIDLVRDLSPDAVIFATGARPIVPDIPGIDCQHVFQAWDVLDGTVSVGNKIVIIGGNAVGLETALYLASVGTISPEVFHFLMVNNAESHDHISALLNKGLKEIIVVELDRKAGRDIGSSSRWTIMAELKRLGVVVKTDTKAVRIMQDRLEYEKSDGNRGLISADSIVLATGAKPNNGLADEVKGVVGEVITIGDARDIKNALESIREGYFAGLRV